MLDVNLRLRVAPPYAGESLSSFVGRTAQFYATPYRALQRQLIHGDKIAVKEPSDWDLNPSPMLERRLAQCVEGWRSPLDDFHGFFGPVIIQRSRHAYCPRCFSEDLAAGRIPYFRIDWSAFYVSVCWSHQSLLLPWYNTTAEGLRRLPKGWLYGETTVRMDVPDYFDAHLRRLDDFESGRARIYGGLDSRVAIGRFFRLQSLVEKPGALPFRLYPKGEDPLLRIRRVAREVALALVDDVWGPGHPNREIWKLSIEPESYELVNVPVAPGKWQKPIHALRRTVDLNWRRTFLWVIAMSLEGTEEFGSLFDSDDVRIPWRRWWKECLIPVVGNEYRARFAQAMNRLKRRLDGLDWPGRVAPSLEKRQQRSTFYFGRKPKDPRAARKSRFAS